MVKRKVQIGIVIIILVVLVIVTIMNIKNLNNYKNISDLIVNNDIIENSYMNPIIPKGFNKVETEVASWELEDGVPKGWNNGLVIEDEIGNQFVWVPVKSKRMYKYEESLMNINNKGDIEKEEEKEQLENYEGFYVARYEAGMSEKLGNRLENISNDTNDILGIPVSKKGVVGWNYISLEKAKKNAQTMYNNQYLQSDLITSRQWVYLMDWIYTTSYFDWINTTGNEYDEAEYQKEIGNFYDSSFELNGYYSTDYGKSYLAGEYVKNTNDNILTATGVVEKHKMNNIYDLAGNLTEFTDGYVPNQGYFSAGGHFLGEANLNLGHVFTIGVEPLAKLGFRVVLYQK